MTFAARATRFEASPFRSQISGRGEFDGWRDFKERHGCMSPPEGALGKKAPGTCPAQVPGRARDSDESLARSRSASGRAAVAEEVAAGDEGSHLGVGHAPGKHPESAVWVDELMPKLVP